MHLFGSRWHREHKIGGSTRDCALVYAQDTLRVILSASYITNANDNAHTCVKQSKFKAFALKALDFSLLNFTQQHPSGMQ
jgi:hypothetical protein